jgi:cation diffusion facilitator family transporter
MNASIRIQRLVAVFSVILFVGKLWAWFLTHSVAILTDALESIVNVITGIIGLYSVSLAAKPRDANHPYGHGKAEFISAAVEGALILIAGLMIIYQVVYVWFHPIPMQKLDVGISITLVTGILNFFLGAYALRIGRQEKSMTVEAAATHLKSDAYSTFAIVAGLTIVHFTGWHWMDSAIALVFGVVIIVTGYKVLRKSLAGIMDEADLALLKEVIDILKADRRPQWIDLHNMRAIQYGQVLHLDVHLTLPWYWTVKQADREIHELERLIAEHFQGKVELFIHIDSCMPFSCQICNVQPCAERQAPFAGQLEWTLENILANEKHGKNLALNN